MHGFVIFTELLCAAYLRCMHALWLCWLSAKQYGHEVHDICQFSWIVIFDPLQLPLSCTGKHVNAFYVGPGSLSSKTDRWHMRTFGCIVTRDLAVRASCPGLCMCLGFMQVAV